MEDRREKKAGASKHRAEDKGFPQLPLCKRSHRMWVGDKEAITPSPQLGRALRGCDRLCV